MHYVTCKYEFCAAHRILGHEGKCKFLHGHNYLLELTLGCESNDLDKLGMVIDFSDVKSILFKWIDDEWDHNTILQTGDPLLKGKLLTFAEHNGRPPFLFGDPPTAEAMTRILAAKFEELLFLYHDKQGDLVYRYRVSVEKVKLWETSKNCAIYRSKR
jgi:6-pyruvoyltetrahydropterin/6-carboxytetrahydropterin synthase